MEKTCKDLLQKIDNNLFESIIESFTGYYCMDPEIPTYVELVHKCMTELHWDHICDLNGLFQVPNLEFIDTLAQDLKFLFSTLNIKGNILEIGCGNGWLSTLLQNRGINIIPTDSGGLYKKTGLSWHRPGRHVEICEFDEALNKYNPEVVVVCWMPIYEDWTYIIRSTKSVKAYILIGEGEGGRCGTKRTFMLPQREGWDEIKLPASRYCISGTDRGYRINIQKLTYAGLWTKKDKIKYLYNYGEMVGL